MTEQKTRGSRPLATRMSPFQGSKATAVLKPWKGDILVASGREPLVYFQGSKATAVLKPWKGDILVASAREPLVGGGHTIHGGLTV